MGIKEYVCIETKNMKIAIFEESNVTGVRPLSHRRSRDKGDAMKWREISTHRDTGYASKARLLVIG